MPPYNSQRLIIPEPETTSKGRAEKDYHEIGKQYQCQFRADFDSLRCNRSDKAFKRCYPGRTGPPETPKLRERDRMGVGKLCIPVHTEENGFISVEISIEWA
ncbi:hypothetical protein WA026_002502 [Henosepilachna vigintioctopunctata]|uniref:Uncharacterized protein n=1 Tax=Henosepilachna vigintioctopunctata TaxID=420089 RepID=A0AAW1U0J7_9CUCU